MWWFVGIVLSVWLFFIIVGQVFSKELNEYYDGKRDK